MSDSVIASSGLRQLVEFVGTAVTSQDVDAYARFQEADGRAKKMDAVLRAWSAQEDHYRKSRERYATWVIVALLFQAVLVNAAFFLIGFQLVTVETWVANSFILAVFAEMTSLVLIVFKYFFPSSPSRIVELVERV